MIRFERAFTSTAALTDDNRHLLYAKAFAKSIEWLYNKDFFLDRDGNFSFVLSQYYRAGGLSLVDLVNLSQVIISKSFGDFALSEVGGIIEEMEKGRIMFLEENNFYLQNDGQYMTIGKVDSDITKVVLWTAYVYVLFRSELTPENNRLQRAKALLYDLFRQKTGLSEEELKGHFLMKHLSQTMATFAQNSGHTLAERTTQAKGEAPYDLQSRIKELEAENTKLKAKIKDMEEAQADVCEEIDWQSKVRLELLLRLMKKDGANIDKYGNKNKAASFMQAITGLSISTCKNYCTNQDLNHTYHEEEKLKLNSILQALEMETRL